VSADTRKNGLLHPVKRLYGFALNFGRGTVGFSVPAKKTTHRPLTDMPAKFPAKSPRKRAEVCLVKALSGHLADDEKTL